MKSEQTAILDDQIAKGTTMQAALNNGLQSFFDDKEAQLFQAFRNCNAGDTETLATIHYGAKALQSLRTEVQGVIDSGKISAVQKEQEGGQY